MTYHALSFGFGTDQDTPSEEVRVLTLQRALRRSGFDPGAADGLYGPRTEAALQQAANAAGVGSLFTPLLPASRRARSVRLSSALWSAVQTARQPSSSPPVTTSPPPATSEPPLTIGPHLDPPSPPGGNAESGWLIPTLVIGGTAVAGAIAFLAWRSSKKKSEAASSPSQRPRTSGLLAKRRAARRQRMRANTHRSLHLASQTGGTWTVQSENPEMIRRLNRLAEAVGSSRSQVIASGPEPVHEWTLRAYERSELWTYLREILREQRKSQHGLVSWTDQRLYDFLSSEHNR